MKSTFYLKHDLDARNDQKMVALRMKLGASGYGIYWMIAEKITGEGGRIVRDYQALAWEFHVPAKDIKAVVEDHGCFYDADGKIACRRIDRDLADRREAQKQAAEAGRRSGEARRKAAAELALNGRSSPVEQGQERKEGEEVKTAAPAAADLSKKLSTTVDKLCKTPIPEANLDIQLPFSFGDIPKGRRVLDIDPTSCRAILDKAARLGLDLRRALEARIKIKQDELHPQLRSA